MMKVIIYKACFGRVGLVTSRLTRFASVWLNAFGRVINNHKYCELLVMRN